MRRLLLSILILLYIVVSSGITVSFHYCMGKLSDLELITSTEQCSSCGQKQTSSHCCSTEAHFIKLAVDQNAEHLPVVDFTPAVLSLLSDMWGGILSPVTEKWSADVSTPPAFRQKEIPLFIYHCLLLI